MIEKPRINGIAGKFHQHLTEGITVRGEPSTASWPCFKEVFFRSFETNKIIWYSARCKKTRMNIMLIVIKKLRLLELRASSINI
jgi:hypothetical protein